VPCERSDKKSRLTADSRTSLAPLQHSVGRALGVRRFLLVKLQAHEALLCCVRRCPFPVKLPNPDRAVIERSSEIIALIRHRRGRHQARVFAGVLGITRDQADILRQALLAATSTAEVTPGEQDDDGQRYVPKLRSSGSGRNSQCRRELDCIDWLGDQPFHNRANLPSHQALRSLVLENRNDIEGLIVLSPYQTKQLVRREKPSCVRSRILRQRRPCIRQPGSAR
jgi:hypothetical protein